MTQVSNLSGPALDWAVEFIEGGCKAEPRANYWLERWIDPERRYLCESASTKWAHGGPIIERELIDIASKFICATAEHPNGTWGWQATAINEDDKAFWHDGPTPLIAAMRCFVASKLGESINLPEELQ